MERIQRDVDNSPCFFLCGYESKVFRDNVLTYIYIFIVGISYFLKIILLPVEVLLSSLLVA